MPREIASDRTPFSQSLNAGRGGSCAAGAAAATATAIAAEIQMARTRSVYRVSSARTAPRGIVCFAVQYAFHGSARNRATRRGTVAIVNWSGVFAADSSFHVSGTETVASGFARVENAAIDVFVRLLRR